jgi:hypothetical protein
MTPPPCSHKVRHRDEASALVAAARSAGRHNASTLRAYRCEHCRGWHLTSAPARLPFVGQR